MARPRRVTYQTPIYTYRKDGGLGVVPVTYADPDLVQHKLDQLHQRHPGKRFAVRDGNKENSGTGARPTKES